jgi:beta-glucosidase
MRRPLASVLLLAVVACSSGDSKPPASSRPDAGGADAGGGARGDAGGKLAVNAALEAKVDDLLAQMTLDEKLAMMAGTGAPKEGLWPTPGVPRLGLPGYLMTDGARGLGATQSQSSHSEKATAFPVGSARGAAWDEALEERIGEAIGAEARAWGANVILAPVVNVLRHPAWGRSQETYGEDPVHLGKLGSAFVRGAQHHVLANVKHLAVNDIEDTRFTVNVTVDERTLREVFLAPFRATVEAGVGSMMSAYNQLNGRYCSENAHILSDILRGEWHFDGFVESDWVAAVRTTAPSVKAGLDIEMPSPNHFAADKLHAAIDAGELSEAVVDTAVRRMIRKLLELPTMIDAQAPGFDVIGSKAHAALALDAARESITLLENRAGALPLDRAKIQKVAVVGTFAGIARLGDEGSSNVVPGHAVTPLEGLRHRAPGVTFQQIDADTLTAADEQAVTSADAAIVVVGLTWSDEGENLRAFGKDEGDRKTLALHPEHEALIQRVGAGNPRTIVVIEAGSAVTMQVWKGAAAAILMAWYPGQEGGDAIADVLFGDVNPSGRLPVTFPVAEADLPPFDHTSDAVTYDYFHGYRYVDHRGTAPLFPFGFGLSYTSFAFANLKLSTPTLAAGTSLTASVDVTNTGTVAGDEVVQLYVSTTGSAVDRAPQELKAFARVHVEPGKTEAVSLPLAAKDLAYYDVKTSAWKVEALTYTVSVGASSRDLPLSAAVTVR